MADAPHAFISHVTEDSADVDKLCALLAAAGIPVWRFRDDLDKGGAWKEQIRAAIRSGALAFLPCFSANSRGKDTSYMNAELHLAVEEYQLRPPGTSWIFPIRFDDGDIPNWTLSGNQTINDLQRTDLFDDRYTTEAVALTRAISDLFGKKTPDPLTIRATVEEAQAAERAPLVRRLTREMLASPNRRIELDELVEAETRRILTALNDPAGALTVPSGSTRVEAAPVYVETTVKIWDLARPFCESLRTAVQYGTPDQLSPWIAALRDLGEDYQTRQAGVQLFVDLLRLPVLASVMTIALAAVRSEKWENAKTLLVDLLIEPNNYTVASTPLPCLTNPWAPFDTSGVFTEFLTAVVVDGASINDLLPALERNNSGRYGQRAERHHAGDLLHHFLQPVFADTFHNPESYARAFDRAEVMLGLISTDWTDQGSGGSPYAHLGGSKWFGRSTFRATTYYPGNALGRLADEARVQGTAWPPLRAGLFGGSRARYERAAEIYGTNYNELVARIW